MPVLNLFKKTEPFCLSRALHLWAENPTDDDYEDTLCAMKKALALRRFHFQLDGWKDNVSIPQWFQSTGLPAAFPDDTPDDVYLAEAARAVVNISIADYDFWNVSQSEQKYHPLVDRTCEINPIFKIFHFFHFIDLDFTDNPPKQIYPGPAFLGDFRKLFVPDWIAPPCGLWLDMDRMLWRSPAPAENFQALQIWGRILDNFLQTAEDFQTFYYLLDVLWGPPEQSEYDFLKLFSLCELLLARKAPIELDQKLPQFLSDDLIPTEDKSRAVSIMRKIRNKIAHGEFTVLEGLLQTYRTEYMYKPRELADEDFDYGEYSLRNWTIGNLCLNMHEAARKILFLMLTDKEKLNEIRNS